MPVFVDANCFKGYIDGVISAAANNCRTAVETILSKTEIALDDKKLFEQEWRDCTGGHGNIFVGDHIADLMEQGKIVIYEFSRDHQLRKKLSQIGVPGKDVRIVEFCAGAKVDIITSNDIDLYEPSQKGCKSSLHLKFVHQRRGSICRYVEKNLKIVICCCCLVPQFV
ncbi:hypothetical protein [Mesorhizobium sp. M0296]|uniref:hypothetical protein n=1 Tax=Mesorhizobium sp. M0296 TaxID=2956931 RepID=UPI00333BE9E6